MTGMPAAQSRDSTLVAKERANSLIHGVGFLLSVAGLVVAIVLGVQRGDGWVVTSVSIYGATLILLYATSTLYHAAPSPRRKRLLQKLDHAAIFLLIAGTYTPFLLVNLRGPWGWSLFAVVWGLALVGGGFKLVFAGHLPFWSSGIYLLLGWLLLIAAKPLLASVPRSGLVLLVLGGVCYTSGVAFYLWRQLPFHHAIWHVFVLAGSICHYFAVLESVT